jgi:hypothetical protein
MDIFGYIIPFWVVLLGIIGIVFILWGILKFALKLFLIIAFILLAIIGLDVLIGLFFRIGL